MIAQVGLGLTLAGAVALAAVRLGLLSRSGGWAAAALGTLVFGLGGWQWSLVLITFFATSNGLTRFLSRRKQDLNATFSKGGSRDAAQVLANGGVAGLAVAAHALWPLHAWPWWAFCGALAAANADTWATELGVLSRSTPRLITNLRRVPRGASGGVTAFGTAASLAGALCIALCGMLLRPAGLTLAPGGEFVIGVTLGGLLGSLVDSALGAGWQVLYYCPDCDKETERHPRHTCGSPTYRLRGLAWLDNDLVNGICTLVGALVALAGLFL